VSPGFLAVGTAYELPMFVKRESSGCIVTRRALQSDAGLHLELQVT
jgi:hypothetical protein